MKEENQEKERRRRRREMKERRRVKERQKEREQAKEVDREKEKDDEEVFYGRGGAIIWSFRRTQVGFVTCFWRNMTSNQCLFIFTPDSTLKFKVIR